MAVSVNTTFLSELMGSIAERGRSLLDGVIGEQPGAEGLPGTIELCQRLLSGRGEASGTALGREVLDRYAALDETERQKFFETLAHDFGPDRARMTSAIKRLSETNSDTAASDLHYASEPRRQELLRRLNRAPGGTAALVEMRADLLPIIEKNPALKILDIDFSHLLSSWFNRGFLVLRRIDWASPAIVLEKIIKYEAVHAIKDWDDLRRRIDPPDRRCYAFFHPALVDEPLIFVEVALSAQIPGAIQPLLSEDRNVTPLKDARVAVFYSISNCQHGLAGISFGNFLIKQVVEELRRELPRLSTFVTLSPVPGFMRWLKKEKLALASGPGQAKLIEKLDTPDWVTESTIVSDMKAFLEPLAAQYFLETRDSKGRVVDPVARFHLGNGARLERINWLGDLSPKGLRESAGIMVNYLYDLDKIEANHEAFANVGDVVAASSVRKMLKTQKPRPVNSPAVPANN